MLTKAQARIALGAALALAVALRFSTLRLQSYWFDEADTALLVKGSFGHMLHLLPDTEASPPLYYVIAWLWARLFGTGEVALRALSALCGSGVVAVIYLIGRRIAGVAAGLSAALLAAVAPFLVWFSQEARDYSLMTLLVALALLAFVRLQQEQEPNGRVLAAWTVWSGLALATHYFAALFLAPMAVWLVVTQRRQRRAIAASLGALAVVAAALAPLALHQHNHARQAILGGFARRLVQLPKQLLVGYHSPGDRVLAVLSAVLMIAALGGLLRSAAVRSRAAGLVAVLIGALLIIAVLAAVGLDYLDSRNMIAMTVPLLALAGIGFAAGGRPGGIAGAGMAAIGLLVVVTIDTTPTAQRDDWRGAMKALGAAAPSTARAIVVTPGQGSAPISIYLSHVKSLTAAAASVSEIDLVGMASRGSGETPVPPAASPAVPMLGGSFVLVEAKRAPLYTLERFRSKNPHTVATTTLANARLSPTVPLVYLQSGR